MSRELIVKKVKVKEKEFNYKYLRTKQAVVILPVLQDSNIILVRQHRIPIGDTIFELPAGGLEAGEVPREAALRELREETGYVTDDITHLTSCYSSPGITDEQFHLYVARVSHQQEQELDEIEEIDVHVYPIKETYQMILDGRIVDAKTILSILWYKGFIQDSLGSPLCRDFLD